MDFYGALEDPEQKILANDQILYAEWQVSFDVNTTPQSNSHA